MSDESKAQEFWTVIEPFWCVGNPPIWKQKPEGVPDENLLEMVKRSAYDELKKQLDQAHKEEWSLRDQLQWSLRNEEKYKARLFDMQERNASLKRQVEILKHALETTAAFGWGLVGQNALAEVAKLEGEK